MIRSVTVSINLVVERGLFTFAVFYFCFTILTCINITSPVSRRDLLGATLLFDNGKSFFFKSHLMKFLGGLGVLFEEKDHSHTHLNTFQGFVVLEVCFWYCVIKGDKVIPIT